jgi:mRNA-degrading endonuclease RelE of RelBE toxin-antitoxin system
VEVEMGGILRGEKRGVGLDLVEAIAARALVRDREQAKGAIGMAAGAYRVLVHDEAQKHLARHDRKLRERLVAKIESLGTDPHQHGVEPITGRPGVHRLRVGGLRIVFRVDETAREVFVEAITPRGQAYKGKRLQRL